jgi:molybdopterin/thiamine biosynthesis adenylyltransferase
MSTMGQPKVAVAARMAQDINPQVEIRQFGEGVNSANVSAFLDGVDLYVDGLDFYAFDARTLVYGQCAAQRIPATMAAHWP